MRVARPRVGTSWVAVQDDGAVGAVDGDDLVVSDEMGRIWDSDNAWEPVLASDYRGVSEHCAGLGDDRGRICE